MFSQILESILSKLGETILSNVVEQTADNAHNNVKSIKDFELILKTLHKNLKSLNAKASDVEEEIKNAELSGRKKRKREVEEWLGEVKYFENEVDELGSQIESEGFIVRLMDGGKAAQLNEQVDKLVEQSRNFGELVLHVCGTREVALLTNELVGEAFNENLERILKLLESRQVSSIGVYGMGGVGKTTLAKHVHNRLLQQSQGRVIWITVSQEFTVTSLQDKIARFIGVDLSDEEDGEIRAARLHGALSQMKNSVLILDDVWENIDMLKVGCCVSVECCRLIITTRSLEVCRQIRCQRVISVEKLREAEAWKLFNETLGNGIKLSPEVEEIAKSVVKLCGGLPLEIITVAGSMRGEIAIHGWKNALVELREHITGQDGMGDDEVYKVLKYSFDRLNRNYQTRSYEFNTFQLCFLYCSLFPEDWEIFREDLIRKLISEGLMDERKSRRAQVELGHSILDKLVNGCLLESCVNYIGRKSVKMHDLLRGMALKIGDGKYMVRAGNFSLKEIPDEQEWTKGLEKVSLMWSGIERIGEGISPDCPNLSTLLLRGNPLEFIPDSFFSKMQGLCSLDLGGTNIRMLPVSLCDMKSLKALLLENCYNLKNVPNLGKLKALRELNLSNTAIKEVPQGLDQLLNLTFLSIDAPDLEMLPSGLLLKLGRLQHVNFPLHIRIPSFAEIETLKLLEEFGGGVENVHDFNWFITSRVRDTRYRIRVGPRGRQSALDLFFAISRYRMEGDLGWYDCNVLVLSKCNLKDERVLGQDVGCLTIRDCEGLSMCFVDDFSRLNTPKSLKRLRIVSCGGIECILRGKIGAAFSSLTWLDIIKCNKMRKLGLPVLGVPNLEYIDIQFCREIEEIFEDEGRGSVTLPKLKRLSLRELPRLRKVGLPASRVPNLEKIVISECGEIEEIFEDEGRCSVTSVTLPKLNQLSLIELPKLKSVCNATMMCNSIEGIVIKKCPRLVKKLPVHVDVAPPPTLRYITVEREWWESLEWENPNLPQLFQPLVYFGE